MANAKRTGLAMQARQATLTAMTTRGVKPVRVKAVKAGAAVAAEVGQDRLADCVGAQLVAGAPAVIIGMGTATTVDILTDRGYAGGIIAPGLGVMTQYLHERTALLPALDPSALLGGPAIGKSTVDAMRSGCALGFAGMIGALLDGVCAELVRQGSPMPKVIVTGGAAVYLPATWQARVMHEPHLTLLGLAEAHRRHFA